MISDDPDQENRVLIRDVSVRNPVLIPDVIRVFIIADADYSVDGLISMLQASKEKVEVYKCSSIQNGCSELLAKQAMDVALIHHTAIDGQIATCFARMRETSSQIRILVFGQNMNDQYLYKLMRSGASGYINEHMSGAHLVAAIKHMMSGRLWAERHILEEFVYSTVELESTIEDVIKRKIGSLGQTLTRRETEVFKMVLNGLATKEIAEELHMSQQAVKLHLGRIFRKFDVTNRSQLILLAFERVCPVSNMIRLFRMTLDKERIRKGGLPLIEDPLDDTF